MADILTMQDLANGHLDVKALGEAANGDENTIVTTRTGNTYPSAERAINIMFQNGGLPAKPFATKAAMTDSTLPDGSYAIVTDDVLNNGLYLKKLGAWVLSAYNQKSQVNVLSSDVNLDTVVDNGSYVTGSFAEITNAPVFATAAFKLDVTTSGNTVYQYLVSHENRVARRRSINKGTSWTVWEANDFTTAIGSTTDLNTLLETGSYFVISSQNSKVLNKPEIATATFKIRNDRRVSSGFDMCYQSVTNHEDRTVTRRTSNGGSTWSSWVEVVTSQTIASMVAPLIPDTPDTSGVTGTYRGGQGDKLPAFLAPKIGDINHLISYGQSLSNGTGGLPVISTTQSANNLTFAGGPRAASGNYLPLKPLVEDALTAPDGGTNRGETLCSGAANYASKLMLKDEGITPSEHVILATSAGRGAYRISQLNKGNGWYNDILLAHITNAVNYCASNNKEYALPAVSWAQGEFDQDKTDITQQQYYDLLAQLQKDIESDAKVISGQIARVPFITYQTSHETTVRGNVALAQLQIVKDNPNFYFSTPVYHLPHVTDTLHLTNVGNKLFGCYVGRVYKQLVIEQIHPEWLEPLSASIDSPTRILVNFNVPQTPLVLDEVNLPNPTNKGFKLHNSSGAEVAITSVEVIDGDKVAINVADSSAVAKVRYALDYTVAGRYLGTSACGSLRDSTADTVSFNNNTYNLWHVAPHFELDVLSLQV